MRSMIGENIAQTVAVTEHKCGYRNKWVVLRLVKNLIFSMLASMLLYMPGFLPKSRIFQHENFPKLADGSSNLISSTTASHQGKTLVLPRPRLNGHHVEGGRMQHWPKGTAEVPPRVVPFEENPARRMTVLRKTHGHRELCWR